MEDMTKYSLVLLGGKRRGSSLILCCPAGDKGFQKQKSPYKDTRGSLKSDIPRSHLAIYKVIIITKYKLFISENLK